MTFILLSKKQKFLLRYQRKNVLDTATDSSQESELDQFDPMKLMRHKDPVVK